jgi:hypothetical protein
MCTSCNRGPNSTFPQCEPANIRNRERDMNPKPILGFNCVCGIIILLWSDALSMVPPSLMAWSNLFCENQFFCASLAMGFTGSKGGFKGGNG